MNKTRSIDIVFTHFLSSDDGLTRFDIQKLIDSGVTTYLEIDWLISQGLVLERTIQEGHVLVSNPIYLNKDNRSALIEDLIWNQKDFLDGSVI